MKRKFGLLSVLIPAAILIVCGSQAARASYADVPENALGAEVRKAAQYGIMNGLSANFFGYSELMTRAQFVTALDRLLSPDGASSPEAMDMELSLPETMELPDTLSKIHRASLSRAVAREVVDSSLPFRPDAPVTREAIAEMLVKALGLNEAALSLSSNQILSFHSDQISAPLMENPTPFLDLPEGKEGYAIIAYVVGVTKGLSPTLFGPDAIATRAQAAAMLTRIYEKIHQEADFHHVFYDSSSELETAADVVSVEWSRMTWANSNAVLTTANGSERRVPSDYKEIVETLTADGTEIYLSVFMDVSGGVDKLLASKTGRAEAVRRILQELTAPYSELGRNPYGGVTVDFQGLHKEQQYFFTLFLSELKTALSQTGKGLYVCVAPYLSAGHWDDGYDCRAIAAVADKIILNAYDYHSENLNNFLGTEAYKNEVPSPLCNVFLSLWKLTKAVPDTSKLLLGISVRPTAWEIGQDDQLLSGVPASPDADALQEYLQSSDAEKGWSAPYQTPYAVYKTPQGDHYFVWYENEQSLRKKAEIAGLFGVTGFSY